MLTGKPYKTGALFIFNSNPVYSAPASFREALRKVPFVVTFSLILDETAEESDLILPDCTSLERWDLNTETPGFAVTSATVGQPALNPLYKSRASDQVILELAKTLGGNVAASFPWKEPVKAIQDLTIGLYRARRGTIFTDQFKEEHLHASLRERVWKPQRYATFEDFRKELIAMGGWLPHHYATFEDFWKDLTAMGGWFDPSYKYGDYGRTLRTPSGKFELSSLLTTGTTAQKEEENYPFYLYLFQPLAFKNETSAALPFLQEIAGSVVHSPWDSWVEINPKSAKKMGIKDGDWVIIESPTNKVKTRARLFSGAMSDVVNIPVGQGHTALGRWAKGRGINPVSLLKNGAPTKVRITKA